MAGRRGRRRYGEEPPDRPDQEPEPPTDPYAVARAIVLRQLTIAPRSRAELATKLAQRGCDPEVAEAVLDRMTEVGLVNDQAYAEMLVRSRQEIRGLGRRGIGAELRRKGIDPDLSAELVGDIASEDERARAVELVQRRVRTMHGLPRETQTRRLAGMLARKGYDPGIVMSAVREVLDQLPEHLPD